MNIKLEDIHVFIVHYKKLTERKTYLDAALRNAGFVHIHWFDEIDRDSMSPQDLKYYVYDEKRWNSLNSTWHHYESPPRKLLPGEIACAISHVKIHEYIVENDIPYSIILEDDCRLMSNFPMKLNKILSQVPDDFDVCHLGNAFGWDVTNYKEQTVGYLGTLNKNVYSPDKAVYKMSCSKTLDSILISNKASKIILDKAVPFCLPFDWMMTPTYLTNNMQVFWADPPLFDQGSMSFYKSSIRD